MTTPERSLHRRPGLLAAALGTTTALLLAFPPAARAEATYPGDVDMALGVPGVVEKMDPPSGCQLCHTDPAGGTTTLTPFANDLVARYEFPKAAAVEDANVLASLAKLKAAEPKLWADMQAGIDPNSDPVFLSGAPPAPGYGCSSSGRGGASETGSGWCPALAFGVMLAQRRRRRSRSLS
jgi:hypothetical protein